MYVGCLIGVINDDDDDIPPSTDWRIIHVDQWRRRQTIWLLIRVQVNPAVCSDMS